MNKILGFAAGASMLALVAMPAMAKHNNHNHAIVDTTVISSADTGHNQINGGEKKSQTNGNWLQTGNDFNHTLILTRANDNLNGGDSKNNHNHAIVDTTVISSANTGNNQINGGGRKSQTNGNTIQTGNASNHTAVVTVVNTNMSL